MLLQFSADSLQLLAIFPSFSPNLRLLRKFHLLSTNPTLYSRIQKIVMVLNFWYTSIVVTLVEYWHWNLGFEPFWFCICRAAMLPREYGGFCIQMRLHYSPFAPFLLHWIEWMDFNCTDPVPSFLGLFHILLYKVRCFPQFLRHVTTSLPYSQASGKILFLAWRFLAF